MMTRRSTALFISVVITAALVALAIGGRGVRRAQADVDAASLSLMQASRDARTVARLRAQAPTIEARQRPTQDLIAQVNASLADVGIPSSHLQSLSPEGESDAAAGLRQQSLRLTLRSLAPAQVGAFLAHWHTQQRVWIAARLELVHNRESPNANLYDVTIIMTAMYVAEASAPSPSSDSDSSKERR